MGDITELKPCPFCGGEPMFDEIISERYKDSDKFLIICTNCMNQTNTYLYKDEAIKAWNTRSTGWISVKDKTPFHGQYTLTFHPDSEPQARVHAYSCSSNQWNRNTGGLITHWQPLPPAPELPKDIE